MVGICESLYGMKNSMNYRGFTDIRILGGALKAITVHRQ